MKETIVVTTLVENSVHARGLLAEHGLAFHIQVGPRSLLFDTGQSDLLLHNALKLRISLAGAEAIVLSHGHNDHTGGIEAAREAAPKARLFLHPAALSPKFAGNPDGTTRSIGMDEASAETIRKAATAVVWTSQAHGSPRRHLRHRRDSPTERLSKTPAAPSFSMPPAPSQTR